PERWQSPGNFPSFGPPQERTVSRRRKETSEYASLKNSGMIFGNRTANHLGVFVPELCHDIDKSTAQKITRQTQLRFVCRAVCDAQKTKKRQGHSGQGHSGQDV
ncbi:hypothetical protein ACM3V7_004040, partial [Escherichia coli]